MNGGLKINYSEIASLSKSVLADGEAFKDQLDSIKKTNSELETYWQGQDASKYTSAVETQAKEMQKLADTINEIGEFLKSVGDKYQAVMQENASAIKG